jgi:hypothetical protein
LIEGPLLVRKLRRQAAFDLLPGQTLSQHRQRMTLLDHLIEAASEKIFGHWRALQNTSENSQFLRWYFYVPESFSIPKLPLKPSIHAGCRGFAGPTI